MKTQRNAFKAGLFMLVSVLLVILAVVAISGASRFTQHFNTYTVSFALADDVGGLQVGDDVRLGGVKVGSVKEIQVRQPANIDVSFDIPAEFKIAANAQITAQKALTGPADVNITNLGDGAALAPGTTINGNPDQLSTLMGNLATASTKLNDDLDKFGQTADAATDTVRDVHQRIPQIHKRYDDLIAAAIGMLDAVRDFLGPSSIDFHTAVAHLSQALGDIHEKLPGILDQVHGVLDKVDSGVAHADKAMEDIQATAANARDLTGSAASIIRDNRTKISDMISSLKAASDNLKFATVEIRHSPWRLLYQPKPEEMSNLNVYDSVRQFAEGANSLQDAAGALRDAASDPSTSPEDIKKLMQQLDDSFAKFQQVQQKMWAEIKG